MSEIAGQTGLRRHDRSRQRVLLLRLHALRARLGAVVRDRAPHRRRGREFVQYVANGQVVPSPLSRPTCANCDNHVVRIMRPGRVASARDAAHRPHRTPARRTRGGAGDAAGRRPVGSQHHHWHLSDLLHVFQRKAS